MSRLATIAEADREYADNVGAMRPDRCWILSDRDVWYRNPHFSGPTEPHPDDAADDANNEADEAEWQREQADAEQAADAYADRDLAPAPAAPIDYDDDIPF